MKIRILFAVAAMFGTFALSAADAPAKAEIIKVNANNNGNAVKTVKLPAMALKDGEKAVLSFQAWIPSNYNSGWTNALLLRMNGKVITASQSIGRKEFTAEMGKNKTVETIPLFNKKNQLLTFYAKDIALGLDKRITSDREIGFTFKMDVTDMVSADRENYLTFQNVRLLYAMRKIFKNPKYEFIVCISDLKLTAEKSSGK